MWCIYTIEFYLDIKNKTISLSGKTDGIGDYNIKQNEPESERQTLHAFSHVESSFKCVCETKVEEGL